MKILVFVSKWIGNEMLNVLFSKFSDDEYIFVVSEPNSEEIINNIRKNGCQYMMLNQLTIDWIFKGICVEIKKNTLGTFQSPQQERK